MLPRKSMLVAVVSAVIMVGPGAGAAFAGEVTGNGEPTGATEHANSICVFSGKNDKPDAPLDVEDPGGVSQSYGQELKLGLVDPHLFNPGDACQGGSNFARQ